MHEVGHTLGLRHNFKASSALSLAEVNNPAITAKKGNSGSVMDYLPANIARKGEKQGDYFSPTIGAYDYWAIEYAYKPVEGDEKEELAKIAAKDAAPDLTYGTDEDMFLNPDPRINAFDLGDPLDYAKDRIQLVRASLDKLQERVVAKGEGWQRARAGVLRAHGRTGPRHRCSSAAYVGGEYTCRDHRGDSGNRPSMKPIEIAKQREAIRLLQDEILSAKAFQFKPELLRQLAPDHWYDDFSMMPVGELSVSRAPARCSGSSGSSWRGSLSAEVLGCAPGDFAAGRAGPGIASDGRGLRRPDELDLDGVAGDGRRFEKDSQDRPVDDPPQPAARARRSAGTAGAGAEARVATEFSHVVLRG